MSAPTELQFTFIACADLKAIWEAIAMPTDAWGDNFSDKLQAARDFTAAFAAHCDLLAQHPHLGLQRDDLQHGIRSSGFERYVVFYRMRGERVEVLRVLRALRDIEPQA